MMVWLLVAEVIFLFFLFHTETDRPLVIDARLLRPIVGKYWELIPDSRLFLTRGWWVISEVKDKSILARESGILRSVDV